MKKIFTQFFFFATVLLASANLSAQTYNGGVWYSLYDEKEHSNVVVYTNFAEKSLFTPVESITFDYKKFSLISINGKVEVQNLVDGKWQKKGDASYSDYKNYKTSSTISLDANATKIRYYLASGNGVYVKNHFATLAKHILLADGDFGKTADSKVFEEVAIGSQSVEQIVNLRSFLSAGDITITSDNPAFRVGSADNAEALVWAVGANACASVNGVDGALAGGETLGDIDQYQVAIYFCPQTVGETSGTITITDGTSTATISVTGVGYVGEKMAQEIVWDDNMDTVNVFDTLLLNATAITEVTYAVSDTTKASVQDNMLVLHNAGEVVVYAYAKESDMYLADTLAKTIVIAPLAQEIVWTLDTLVMTVGDTLVLNAVATSGLEVSYYLSNGDVFAMESNMLIAQYVGEVEVAATQDGNNNYLAAESVTYTITVVAKEDVETGLEDVMNDQLNARKVIRNGRIYIEKDNAVYDVLGKKID